MISVAPNESSVFSGFLWEIGRIYTQNKYKVKSVFWFNSASNQIINNDNSTIMVIEPIINVDDETRQYVIDNLHHMIFYLEHNDDQWTLVKP